MIKTHTGLLSAWVLVAALGTANAADPQWTLSTEDTCMQVSVSNSKIHIDTLKNPAQGWNWTPTPSGVPLPGVNSVNAGTGSCAPDWKYCDATEDKADGLTVTLRFTSKTPNLELNSTAQ